MFTGSGLLFFGMFFCLIGSFFAFSLIGKKGRPTFNAPFVAVSALLCFAVLASVFLFWEPSDFISSVTPAAFAAPAVLLLFLAMLSLVFPQPQLQFILLALSCGGIVFGFDVFIRFSSQLPPLPNKILTAVLWLAICYFPRVINLNTGIVCIQTLTIALGALLLYFINALPLAVGMLAAYTAACFIGLLVAARNNPNLRISDLMCNLLGFLLGWLTVYASAEGAGSCFAVFAIYPLIEVIFALAQKLTFLPQFAIAKNNTLYLRMIDADMTPSVLNRYLLRISAICILFGSFQAFAPNDYSIPVFCLLVVLWQLYRIYNWRELPSGLKETNKKFISDVKNNLQEISQILKDRDKSKK